jgi:hypothetical protein
MPRSRGAAFLIQLESWEAALKSGFIPESPGKAPQPIDIAKLLGWVEFHTRNQAAQLNDTARACSRVTGKTSATD